MLFSVHYEIGDALSRSEDAREVLFSPTHTCGLGLFGSAPGGVATAVHGRHEPPQPGRAIRPPQYCCLRRCHRPGPGQVVPPARPLRAGCGWVDDYLLPQSVIIFYCGNGMSEASFYLQPLFLLGSSPGSRGRLALAHFGLHGLAASMGSQEASRLCVVAAWSPSASAAGAPSQGGDPGCSSGCFVFGLWTFANWLIMAILSSGTTD